MRPETLHLLHFRMTAASNASACSNKLAGDRHSPGSRRYARSLQQQRLNHIAHCASCASQSTRSRSRMLATMHLTRGWENIVVFNTLPNAAVIANCVYRPVLTSIYIHSLQATTLYLLYFRMTAASNASTCSNARIAYIDTHDVYVSLQLHFTQKATPCNCFM